MNKTYRLELFAFYDHVGITAHLEKMAAKGWLLEEIGPYFWEYRKTEPQTVRFSVIYQTDTLVLQRDYPEKQQRLRDYCELEGWTYTASKGCMQIYRNVDPEPVPIETDAVLQVAAINEAAWRSHLRTYWVLSGLAFFLLLFCFMLVSGSSSTFADVGWMTLLVVTVLFLTLGVVELVAYYSWYEKAEKLAREQGMVHPTKSRRGFQIAALVFAVLLVCSQTTDGLLLSVLRYGSVIIVPVVLGTGGGKLADRLKLPPAARWILSLLLCGLWLLLVRTFWMGSNG